MGETRDGTNGPAWGSADETPGISATEDPQAEAAREDRRSAPEQRQRVGPTTGQGTISIVVPVHDGSECARTCLLNLAKLQPAPHDVTVVCDGDAGGSADLARELGFGVVECLRRGGPARARNLGACRAAGEILFFTDSDVVLPPGAIRQMAAAFEADPGLAAVIGSYDDDPPGRNFLSQYKNLFHHYVHQAACEQASTFWGACGAIRRDVFGEVDGFDEGYGVPCVEDIELGYRLRQRGYRIRLCKSIQVKHLKTWTPISLLKTDFFCRALPWTKLILRHRRFVNDLNLRSASRASVAMAYAVLISLIGAGWWLGFLAVAGAAAALLLAVNAPLYLFFRRKRGLWFAMKTVPWHWLYYLYSGLAFGIGLIRHVCDRRKPLQARARERKEMT